MKKLLIGLVVLALGGSAGADVFRAKLGERLAIPIKMALDTLGRAHTPDSVEVTSYQQGATAATKFRSYSYANATASTGWFDSTLNGGRVNWWLNTYVDSLGSTPTSKIIGLNVTTFYQGVPFEQTHLVEVGSYNFDSTAYRGAVRAIGDSTASLTTLKDTIPKYTWAYDSASAAGGAATTMGRQLTKDVTATTDTLAAARAVWRVDLSAYATGTFPTAGKLQYLAGDSTTYVNQYSVWNVPFGYAFTAGTMGDSLNNPTYVGNVGAVSGDATAADNLETMLDGTGGGTFTVKQLNIGGAAGINGALYVHNSDGPALNVVSSSSSANAADIYNSSSGSTAGLSIRGAFGNGTAIDLTAFGIGSGIKATASTGNGISAVSTSGYGIYANSTGSDGFYARGGGSSGFGMKLTGSGSGAGFGAIGGTSGFAGSFISSGAYGLFAQGTSAGILGYSASGIGLYGWGATGMSAESESGGAGFIGVVDSVAGVGSGGAGGSDTTAILALAQNHPSAFYGPTSSGGLTYAVGLYVIDTGANPDEVLQGVDVSIADTGGTLISWGKTNQAGYVQLAADAGTYTIRAVHRPWSFPVKTVTVTADVDSTELDGYNSVTGSRCRVYGYITDWGINPTEFATVTFTMPEGVNGSDSAILLDRSVTVETDDDGYFFADLARSSYLSNKQWQVTINYPGVSPIKRSVTVPDATSYKLGW